MCLIDKADIKITRIFFNSSGKKLIPEDQKIALLCSGGPASGCMVPFMVHLEASYYAFVGSSNERV